jgi:hypothetical protein
MQVGAAIMGQQPFATAPFLVASQLDTPSMGSESTTLN